MPKTKASKRYVKIYHGYGHQQDLLLYGHVFRGNPPLEPKPSNSILVNTIRIIKMFFVKPVPAAPVSLKWDGTTFNQTTEKDGFLKFEWQSGESVAAGWHRVQVDHTVDGEVAKGEGKLFVPHITQYAFISDIDDTIMVSHSATILRRLKELFTRGPLARRLFPSVSKHYQLLAKSNTEADAPNPFFYVSSSEWNLYDYLREIFLNGKLPEGAFLLSQVKRWFELFKSGKTNHMGKLLRVVRILEVFPNQKFVLLGDNTQRDPVIYREIAEKYPDRIYAVYIRNVYQKKEAATRELMQQLHEQTGVHTCFFSHSDEAIEHSHSIGLIDPNLFGHPAIPDEDEQP